MLAAAAVLLAGLWAHAQHRREQAELALHDGQRQLHDGRDPAAAVQTLQRGLGLLDGLPFERDLRGRLGARLATARRLHLAEQLHRLGDEIRSLYGVDAIPVKRLRSLVTECDAFWQRRDAVAGSLDAARDPDVAADLQDVAIFAAHLQVKLGASAVEVNAGRREALRLLDEAEAMFGSSAVLEY